MLPGQTGGPSSSCTSAGMDVRGSVGIAHAGTRKRAGRNIRVSPHASCAAQREVGRASPKVRSKVSRRSLLPLGLAGPRNCSRLVGACSRETCLNEWHYVAEEQCGK